MKQSFTFWSFNHRGLGAQELLEGAARLGYQAVELVDESFFLW
ncbi:MAG: hypothetical protein R2865_11675 [Deinococcales bacterium]